MQKNGSAIKSKSGEIYKSLFENCSSVMFIIHPETGRFLDANKAACRYYGYKKNELKEMHIQDINMLSNEQIFQEMQDAKDECRNHFNFKHRLVNGEIRDVEVFTGPITIGNEKVLYSVIHDISERKRIEEQIEIEKRFSESLIHSLPGVMYVFDQKGRFKRWNRNFEVVAGYSAKQIKTMAPLDFIAGNDRTRVKKAIDRVFNRGKASVEAAFLTRRKKSIPYFFTGYRLVQMDIDYLVGVGVDISKRAKSEKEKEMLIKTLQATLSQVKKLSGLLPICASCKKIRDDKGYWKQIESYIKEHSEAEFSHSICPECAKKLYDDLDLH